MAARKKKMERTEEGYRMKKMSADNIDYNVLSQDISRKPVKVGHCFFILNYDTGLKKKFYLS